jgi:hypothetical protein
MSEHRRRVAGEVKRRLARPHPTLEETLTTAAEEAGVRIVPRVLRLTEVLDQMDEVSKRP